MTQFSFSYKIDAIDNSESGLADALGSLRGWSTKAAALVQAPFKFGGAALGFLRDFNLGLKPLLGGLDSILDTGLRLEAQQKSFEALTGKQGKQARELAKSLVAAANGTLTLAKAQQIANRALASNIQIDQLGTLLDFASRKSITTGKDPGQAIDTLVTGLARGSTLFLDDFGILVDGIDGVRRTFDSINGEGAFDALGPAAQKAEIIRQALAEMNQQMGNIGVTGKESFFVLEGIKNSLKSSLNQLIAAVARSKDLRDMLAGVQSLVGGTVDHLEKGGSLSELLFGKKGGKSGGLLGIGGAVLTDAGVLIGKGFVGVLFEAIERLGKPITEMIDSVIKSIRKTWDDIKTNMAGMLGLLGIDLSSLGSGKRQQHESRRRKSRSESIIPRNSATEEADYQKRRREISERHEQWRQDWEKRRRNQNRTESSKSKDSPSVLSIFDTPPQDKSRPFLDRLFELIEYRVRFWLGYPITPSANPNPRDGRLWASSQSANPALLFPSLTASAAIAGGNFLRQPGDLFRSIGDEGRRLIADALGFNRTRKEIGLFRADFPNASTDKAGLKPLVDADSLIPLTQTERQRRRRERSRITNTIDLMESGNRGVRAEARRRAIERIRRLRADGRDVLPRDRRRIFDEEFKRTVKESTDPLREQIRLIDQSLAEDKVNRDQRIQQMRGDDGSKLKQIAEDSLKQVESLAMMTSTGQLIAALLDQLVSAAGGFEQRLAAIGFAKQ